MKDFSKTHLTFLVLALLLGAGGGYFWYWSVDNLATKTRAREALVSKLTQVEKKALPPTPAVLAKLQENEKAFQQLSEKSLEELKQNLGLFDSVVLKQEAGKLPQGLPPDAWKKLMNDRRLELDKLAAKNKVPVFKEPYYGFQRYRVPNPDEKFTGQLGIQLLGLSEISHILLDAKVREYAAAKRAGIEDAGKAAGSSGAPAGAGPDETFSAAILPGPENLYQVYPFEVYIRCSTEELRDVINRLNQSKYFFVIRFLTVKNEKDVKSRSAIQTEMAASAKQTGRLMFPVAGNEFLQVRLRIDMLVWSKNLGAVNAGAPEAKKAAR